MANNNKNEDVLKAEAEALKAELEAMKAELKASEETKAELEAKLNEAEEAKANGEKALAEKLEKEAYYNEKVPVKLFKDNDKYKDDVFVCLNGERFQIKRGEEVMIPRKIAAILDQSQAQDAKTANLIESKSAEYAAEAKARNV